MGSIAPPRLMWTAAALPRAVLRALMVCSVWQIQIAGVAFVCPIRTCVIHHRPRKHQHGPRLLSPRCIRPLALRCSRLQNQLHIPLLCPVLRRRASQHSHQRHTRATMGRTAATRMQVVFATRQLVDIPASVQTNTGAEGAAAHRSLPMSVCSHRPALLSTPHLNRPSILLLIQRTRPPLSRLWSPLLY